MNRCPISTAPFAVLLLIGAGAAFGATDVGRAEADAARIAAAAGALEAGRAGEARRWLAAVPEGDRDWAWRYLSGRSDLALRVLIEDPSPIVAFAATAEPLRVAAATRDGRLLLRGESGGVRTVTLSSDGESPTGEGVSALAFSGDGGRLACALPRGEVTIVGFDSGRVLARWSVEVAGIGSLAWSPSADRIAVGGFRWIHPDPERPEQRRPAAFLELREASGAPVRALETSGFYVGALAFSPDGARLAAGAPQGWLDVLEVASGERVLAHQITESRGFPQIEALAFSADGSLLGAACGDGTVRLWSTADWGEVGSADERPVHRAGAEAITFLPGGGAYASAGADAVIRIVDGTDPEGSTSLIGHAGKIVGLVALSANELVSGAEDGTVRHWSTIGLERPFDHDGSVWGTAFSRDGKLLATADAAGVLRVWDCCQVRLLREIEAHDGDALSVAFSADASELISTGNDGGLRIWSVDTGERLAELEQVDDGRGVALSLSPDGRTLAAGSSRGTVKLWDLERRKLLHVLGGHRGEVSQALWSPDGSRLFTTGNDGEVVIWDATSGAERSRFRAHDAEIHGAALSPDGGRLATAGSDRSIRIWDLATAARTATFEGHADRIWSLAWSPDGRLLASASNDFTARLWDVATGLPLITWSHPIQVYRVLWSPSGDSLAVAPFDGRVLLLRAPR